MESSMSPNSKYSFHMFGALPTTTNHFVTTTAVAHRFGDALRCRLLFRSYLKVRSKSSIKSPFPHCSVHQQRSCIIWYCLQIMYDMLLKLIKFVCFPLSCVLFAIILSKFTCCGMRCIIWTTPFVVLSERWIQHVISRIQLFKNPKKKKKSLGNQKRTELQQL